MTARGHSASLPATPHRRRAVADESVTVIVHVDEKGDRRAVYDFARMPVSADMQRSLAALFASRLGPSGPWKQILTSKEIFGLLTTFTRFLATLDEPPRDIPSITPAIWNAWVLSRNTGAMGARQISKVAALLRLDPRLHADTRNATLKPARRPAATETSYKPDEFDRITSFAMLNFRNAWQRIRDNQRHLVAWRAGDILTDTDEWRLGEILDHLARNGDVPFRIRNNGHRRVDGRVTRILGGATTEHTWRRLYLSNVEVVSIAVLLVSKHGWNSTSVAELRVPEITDSGGGDPHVTYRLELEKRRRKPPHRYETRNLTDWGPSSPGRLIGRALEATAAARDLAAARDEPTDRLLVWRFGRIRAGEPTLRTGYTDRDIKVWSDVSGVDMNLRRLRRTVVVMHRRVPSQHSRDTHDQTYLLRDPATHQGAAPIIADGVAAAIRDAHRVVRARVSRSEGVGDRSDTGTASCMDYEHSPFSPDGGPCRVSFLLCLACPNAVVTPRHLPRLAYLHLALDRLRGVLTSAVWDHDWREHYVRLTDLRDTAFTPAEWADALIGLSAADREIIDQLLRRGFDA